MAIGSKEVKNKRNFSTIAIIAGWGLTILAVIWQVAMKDATYSIRIDQIEEELETLNTRVRTTDDFRLTISSQLAEIRTDLTWIKQKLNGIK